MCGEHERSFDSRFEKAGQRCHTRQVFAVTLRVCVPHVRESHCHTKGPSGSSEILAPKYRDGNPARLQKKLILHSHAKVLRFPQRQNLSLDSSQQVGGVPQRGKCRLSASGHWSIDFKKKKPHTQLRGVWLVFSPRLPPPSSAVHSVRGRMSSSVLKSSDIKRSLSLSITMRAGPAVRSRSSLSPATIARTWTCSREEAARCPKIRFAKSIQCELQDYSLHWLTTAWDDASVLAELPEETASTKCTISSPKTAPLRMRRTHKRKTHGHRSHHGAHSIQYQSYIGCVSLCWVTVVFSGSSSRFSFSSRRFLAKNRFPLA